MIKEEIQKTEDNNIENQEDKNIKNKKKPLIIVGTILITIISIFTGIAILGKNPIDKSLDKGRKKGKTEILSTTYSEDQKKVISNFGEPEGYKIVYNNNTRTENWYYYKLNEVFTFQNGEFKLRKHFDFELNKNAELITLKFSPKDFYSLTTIDQLNNKIGYEPTYQGEINQELINDAKIYSFTKALDVGEVNGEIVYIHASALTEQEEKNSDESGEVTNITSPDDIFSIDAGKLADQMTVAVEDVDFAEKLYTFCIKTNNPNLADFFCEGQAYPLFTIAAYNFDQFHEQTISPLYDSEIEKTIGTYKDTIYTFSHANGDVPEEIRGEADDYFGTIIKSFKYLN